MILVCVLLSTIDLLFCNYSRSVRNSHWINGSCTVCQHNLNSWVLLLYHPSEYSKNLRLHITTTNRFLCHISYVVSQNVCVVWNCCEVMPTYEDWAAHSFDYLNKSILLLFLDIIIFLCRLHHHYIITYCSEYIFSYYKKASIIFRITS